MKVLFWYMYPLLNHIQRFFKLAPHQPRGFTLIELLVVIAIIGILAAIVLVALGNVRNRGANSGVGANLSQMRTKAELFAQSNGYSYDTFCTNTTSQYGGKNSVDAAVKASGIAVTTIRDDTLAGISQQATCHDNANAWAAEVPLSSPNTQFWCVDSNGFSATTTISTLTAASDVTCN